MKLHGVQFEGPTVEIVPIFRNGKEVIISAQAVLNYSEFDAVCPRPKPPEIMRPGGIKEADLTNQNYLKALDEWSMHRTEWLYLKSLSATPGLEWDTVDMTKPNTWGNYEEEMKKSFTDAERVRIMNAVLAAQGLNNDRIEEARKRFLAGQAEGSKK